MKKISLLSLIAALSVAGSAAAGEVGKFYFKGGVGYDVSHGKVKFKSQGYVPTATVVPTAPPTTTDLLTYGPPMIANGTVLAGESSNAENFSGGAFSAGIGYNVTDAFRADLSFDYKMKQKKKFNIPAGAYLNPSQSNASTLPGAEMANAIPQALADGKNAILTDQEFSRESWMVMVSAYYDFINTSDFVPFVNAGLGYGNVKNKGLVDTGTTPANKNVDSNTKSKSSFAWSVGGGLAYKISDGMYTDIAYKLTGMKAETENKDKKAMAGPTAGTTAGADRLQEAVVKIKTPDISHSVNLGLRVEF